MTGKMPVPLQDARPTRSRGPAFRVGCPPSSRRPQTWSPITAVMVDICLITMPYAEIKLPSMALGLLQAVLERDGFTVRTIYANMHFAEQIGLLNYHTLSLYPPRHGVAEWTFAHIAFPDFHPEHDDYFDRVRGKHRIYREVSRQRFVDRLRSVRVDADSLVEQTVQRVMALNPTIVGCSTTFCQHVPSLAVLRRIRDKAPNIVTMLGGANCESVMGLTTHRAFPWVDVVVSGEADQVIGPLCKAIVKGGLDLDSAGLPRGVYIPAHRSGRSIRRRTTTPLPEAQGASGSSASRNVMRITDRCTERGVPSFSVLGESGANKSRLPPLFPRGESVLPPFSRGGQGGFCFQAIKHPDARTRTRCTPGEGYINPLNDDCDKMSVKSKSMDSLPIPNFDDFFSTLKDSPLLSRAVTPALTVETSRGCWWGQRKRCNFCGLNGRERTFRSKSAHVALKEFERLSQQYGISRFEAVDNILDMNYFATLLPRLAEQGRPFRFFYETKSNLSMRQVKALHDAGVIWIQPGIESLHSGILELMNKGAKAWHNVQLLKFCRQFGVCAGWLILHDVPGENIGWYDEMADMLPLIAHFQPPLKVLPVLFYRFSRYHDEPARYGLDLRPSALLSSIYPVPETELADLVYFFEDTQQERIARDPVISRLLEHRGLERVREEVRIWRSAYWNGDSPQLSMHVTDDEIRVTDTRHVAVEHSIVLRGVERILILALGQAVASDKLIHEVQATGQAVEDIQAALRRLKELRLILEVDDRMIGLPLREPVPDLPKVEDFPGGFIDFSFDVRA